MRLQKVTTLAVAIAIAMPLFAFRAAHESTRPGGSMAAALVEAMNAERTAHGLKPLQIDDALSLAANDRIDDMFAKHYFAHVSPDGINPWTWADRRGYHYHEFGENLAVGYPSAASIVDGWMHSPHHRANVLRADYLDVGVAIATGSPAQPFRGPTVVALYGER